MKKVLNFFLFRSRPDESLTTGKKVLFWGWNWVLLIGAVLVLGMASLYLATGTYGVVLFLDYLKHPGILVMNLLAPVVFAVLIYGIAGRAWIAYLVTALPVLALSIGNFYKLAFRDDPVVAADLPVLIEASKMAGEYNLFYTTKVGAAVVVGVVSTVLLALFARGVVKGWWKRLIIAVAALVAAGALIPVYGSDDVYKANANTEHINEWSTTQQYLSRGLVYPFLYSIKEAMPSTPDGYSKRETQQLLEQYESKDIPEDKKVNVISIMLEAFVDLSRYEQVEVGPSVYEYYHALEQESYTGNLLVNVFAGGTNNTERAFLTGTSAETYNFRTNASSYVWYFKNQGYQTSGDHPSNDWFYNRKNINAYMGFDRYRFAEDHYLALSGTTTARDSILLPELAKSIQEQMATGAPVFSFSVTYQGHGPYGSEQCWWADGNVDELIGNYDLPQPSRVILANYLGSLRNTQWQLETFVNEFRNSEEPVVLVLFGDHKPWLGNNSTVYAELGIELSMANKDTFYNYYGTRYLIWANDAAKETLGKDFVGEGPDISPCFLMNVLFEQCGWEGDSYMQAVRDCWQTVPVMTTNGHFVTADGTYTETLTEEQKALADRFAGLSYYRTREFAY